MVSDDPTKVLAVRVADCVPVLIASDDGQFVAAIHAGWRGVVAGVVPNAVAKLCEAGGGRAAALIAAIGPCIGFDAFEVGMEVVEQFEDAFAAPELVRRTADGKGRIDLRRAIELQLAHVGYRQIASTQPIAAPFATVMSFFRIAATRASPGGWRQ